MSLLVHRFGRDKFRIFVICLLHADAVENIKTDIQNMTSPNR